MIERLSEVAEGWKSFGVVGRGCGEGAEVAERWEGCGRLRCLDRLGEAVGILGEIVKRLWGGCEEAVETLWSGCGEAVERDGMRVSVRV